MNNKISFDLWNIEVLTLSTQQEKIEYMTKTMFHFSEMVEKYEYQKSNLINEQLHTGELPFLNQTEIEKHSALSNSIEKINFEIEHYLNELKNIKTWLKYEISSFYEDYNDINKKVDPSILGVIEKLLILHYLEIDSLKRTILNSKPGINFISKFLEINPDSIKKPFAKIEDYTTNPATRSRAEQLFPTLEKIYQFFIDSDLQRIADKIKPRISELRKIAGKD